MLYYVFNSKKEAPIAVFKSLEAAKEFHRKTGKGKFGKMTSEKSSKEQQEDVRFCMEVLNIDFTGDISSHLDCTMFLYEHYAYAVAIYQDIVGDYNSYMAD